MTITEAELSEMTFGIELEYDRISTRKAAETVAAAVGGTYRYDGSHLSNWVVTMPDGRKWNCETDASVSNGSETVSPILRIGDIPMLQTVVRALRHAGARTGGGAGLHIHVGAAQMTPKQIQNLVKIFYKQEELIVKGCGTAAHRLGWFTRRTDREFVDKMLKIRNPTMANLADLYIFSNDKYRNVERGLLYAFMGADQDEEMAMNVLGLCYEDGIGVPRDSKNAFKWFSRAVENGAGACAEHNLARCYRRGIGTKVDKQKAEELEGLAVEHGYPSKGRKK